MLGSWFKCLTGCYRDRWQDFPFFCLSICIHHISSPGDFSIFLLSCPRGTWTLLIQSQPRLEALSPSFAHTKHFLCLLSCPAISSEAIVSSPSLWPAHTWASLAQVPADLSQTLCPSSPPLLTHTLFFFSFLSFSRATPEACGGSQARDPIEAVATSLRQNHSHRNTRSKPRLQPTAQLRQHQILNSLSKWGQGLNPKPLGS